MHQGYHKAFFRIGAWNLLDQRTVDSPSLNAFKNSSSRIKDNRIGFFMD